MSELQSQLDNLKDSVSRSALDISKKNNGPVLSQKTDIKIDDKIAATNVKTNNDKYQVSPSPSSDKSNIKTISKNIINTLETSNASNKTLPPTFRQLFWHPSNKDSATEVEKAKLIIETDEGVLEFYEFIIESIKIDDSEVASLFKAFNMTLIQSFGKNIKMCNITLTFPHNKLKAWYGNFSHVYDNYIRATKQISENRKVSISIDQDLYKIVPISFSVMRTSAEKYSVTASLSAFITDLNLTENIAQSLIETSKTITKDNASIINLPSNIRNTVTNPIKEIEIANSQKIEKKIIEDSIIAEVEKRPVYPVKILTIVPEEMTLSKKEVEGLIV